ncbi:MAG: hypothetical protein WBO48_06875 [Candidatus Promineifilaceae bacterium]
MILGWYTTNEGNGHGRFPHLSSHPKNHPQILLTARFRLAFFAYGCFGKSTSYTRKFGMTQNLPKWALTNATPQDRIRAVQAHQNGLLQIIWSKDKTQQAWAKKQGWRTSRFSFHESFIKKMLENDETFALALKESGIEVILPIKEYTFSTEQLQELDALYQARGENGRPDSWGTLVEKLRGARRAVEAGVVVTIDDRPFQQFSSFYSWVDERYHMLEDGYDSWVGNDKS